MTKETKTQRETRVLEMVQEIGAAAWRKTWADREAWSEEMKMAHARRLKAIETCMAALAELNDNDRAVAKDRLRDLWDVEEGELDPSQVSAC
jgi:hypothetical protein